MHLKKAYLSLGLEHDPSPFRRQEHLKCNYPDFAPKSVKKTISGSKIAQCSKFLTVGAENDIVAPMAPTPINVTVSLVFWVPFTSFSEFWGKLNHFSAKSLFAQKSQSRPKLLESCSRHSHFWTRKSLEGLFATEECKF